MRVTKRNVLAFFFYLLFAGQWLTTKNYNKLFLSVIQHLEKSEWKKANLAAFLLGQTSETGRFPRDDEFEEKWINAPL
jgi:hypothetical protein